MKPGHYLVDGVLHRAGRRCWTEVEDYMLRVLYPDAPNDVIARFLNRTTTAINARGDILGLHKSALYLASPAACRLRRGGNVGAAHRFQKGQIPANKGLRRPGWHRGRMKETQFKRGESRNKMPIGATRLIGGYVYRKVSDVPFMPYTVNWKPEHHLLWTAAHGPIPRGFALVFKDGDRMNYAIENLELISRRELMARNTVHNLPPALAKTIQMAGALNRKIRRMTRAEEHDRRSA